jgi:hypothetical protein
MHVHDGNKCHELGQAFHARVRHTLEGKYRDDAADSLYAEVTGMCLEMGLQGVLYLLAHERDLAEKVDKAIGVLRAHNMVPLMGVCSQA